jgi:phosphoenolpyruvate phosphomutase
MINEKAQLLRQKMAEQDLVIGVGAGTALEAKLVEGAGFDFVWSSSLAVSAHFAVPDASLISMSQYLAAARSMNDVITIPVIVDADTGYGNANNVIYATQQFDTAGIAAMSIEDKKFPKDNSLLAGGRQELADIDEFAGKIRAAKDSQKSADFVVIARIEALIAGWGEEEALRRATRYAEAGADLILIHSKSRDPEEVRSFSRRWEGPAPLVLVPTNYPQLTEAGAREMGNVKVLIYANHPLRASVRAIEETLREIKEAGGLHTVDERLAPVTRVFELQGVPEMKQNEKKYLPQAGEKK